MRMDLAASAPRLNGNLAVMGEIEVATQSRVHDWPSHLAKVIMPLSPA
ncbi:MAG: hypothetical protein PW735_00645 [Acidobacteriaceae bacterium]|nr:hypothetical protein [Acidobacteriaceae bacterium]